MALGMPKITKRTVEKLRPAPNREIQLWDDELRGFGIRVQPTGTASYFAFYRTADGRQRKITLARVGVVTPDQARRLARETLAASVNGRDISTERRRFKQGITVTELCDAYLKEAEGRVKASTLSMDRSRIERHVKPLLGAVRVASLSSDDIEGMRRSIETGRTAAPRVGRGGVTTGGRGVAGRTLGMLGTILEFARRKGEISHNPVRGVRRPPDRKQTRYLTATEISRLGRTMHEAEANGVSAVGITAIRFLLLSGLRRQEALQLSRHHIDETAGCIRLPDSKAVPQIRAVGHAAFQAVPKADDSEWLFPSTQGSGHFVGLPKVLQKICRRAGIIGVTPHVLRHTFASVAEELGYTELTIAGLLGHRVSGITARYAHMPDKALVSAANNIADVISMRLRVQVEVAPAKY